ncbi:protein of unknown function [Vibrio tapetis subsp. tapetis]|uniref:Uncharacterized protein n=1 Tax=Vibrio tapetis subsp. tapetis TaxID=1671868 RepID=A0A2N8ZLT5_9VIBR|nr:protein of unknown function [Vibrio tapetis subsp. tapetis]
MSVQCKLNKLMNEMHCIEVLNEGDAWVVLIISTLTYLKSLLLSIKQARLRKAQIN